MPEWRSNAERYMSPGEKKVHLEAELDGLIDEKRVKGAEIVTTRKLTVEKTIRVDLDQLADIDRAKAIAMSDRNNNVDLLLFKAKNPNLIIEPKVDVKPSNPLEYTKTSRYNNIFMVFTSLNVFSYIRPIVKNLIPFLSLVFPLLSIMFFYDMSWFLELCTGLFGKIYGYLPERLIH